MRDYTKFHPSAVGVAMGRTNAVVATPTEPLAEAISYIAFRSWHAAQQQRRGIATRNAVAIGRPPGEGEFQRLWCRPTEPLPPPWPQRCSGILT
jgi:hypothetical protein